MNTLENATLVAGFIALVRKAVPKLDGWPVLLVALVLSMAVALLASPTRDGVIAGIMTFVAAAGGTEWAQRLAAKSR